ncbi:hypothetical protein E8E13_008214 [Curvularia kusanoi]|uniref:Heterokaryon incompatibility domain-containing protein n=1 Tax=Curvularia kusanoi TaxID=90978 RepID=A0A9P4TGB6_CURKU|nr:hypothetical protein E8E13_008214 [Curvularia kusanoi]
MNSGSRHASENSLKTVGLLPIANPYEKITTGFSFVEEAKVWIHECAHDHTALCDLEEASRPRFTNLRVIDCHASRDARERLEIVDAPPGCVYFALSYVWGPVAKPPFPLPQTIKDSITTVLLLGYSYLWVDRYCIDQQDAEDKHEQIQQMGAIYAGAFVTIIAYAEHDPYKGLPGVSRDCSASKEMPPNNNEVEISTEKSIWPTRAWTFQEYHLSRRKLFFTDYGRIWECRAWNDSSIKCNGKAISDIVVTKLRSHETTLVWMCTFEQWWDSMSRYSTRKLSYPSDALNAISGVLSMYATRDPPIKHFWGVPYFRNDEGNRHFALIDLGWSVSSAGKRREGFPTWSPLGWQDFQELSGNFMNFPCCSPNFDVEAELDGLFRHLDLITSNDQAMQRISQGSQSLRITAYSAELDIESQPSASSAGSRHEMNLPITKDQSVWIMPRWDSKSLALEPGASVYCVFHSSTFASGLIIKSCGEYFERMGTFVPAGVDQLDFEQNLADALEGRLWGDSECLDADAGSFIARKTFLLR